MDREEFANIPADSKAFPRTEYAHRIAKTRAAMDEPGLGLLLVHSLPDICYLTGFQTPLSDWYHCLILPREGAPVLQVCDPELAAMHSYIDTLLPVSWESMDAAPAQLADDPADHRRGGLVRAVKSEAEIIALRASCPSFHAGYASCSSHGFTLGSAKMRSRQRPLRQSSQRVGNTSR